MKILTIHSSTYVMGRLRPWQERGWCVCLLLVGGIQHSSFEEKWCVIIVSVIQGEFYYLRLLVCWLTFSKKHEDVKWEWIVMFNMSYMVIVLMGINDQKTSFEFKYR